MELDVGQVILRRYLVDRLVGQGSLGRVLDARDYALDQRVAVRVIDADHEAGLAFNEREATLAGELDNVHLVKLHAVGRMPNGDRCVVTEFVDGETLQRKIEQFGRMSDLGVEQLLVQLLEGLAATHALGVIHRDLTPRSIFIVPGQKDMGDLVKMVDFGIDRVQPLLARPSSLGTSDVAHLDSFQYLSPEQLNGLRELDPRSNVYSLGVIAYEALSGHLPFEGTSFAGLRSAILLDEPKPLQVLVPEVDPQLVRLIRKAMAKAPSARFHTAEEMLHAVAAVAGIAVRDASGDSSGDEAIPGVGSMPPASHTQAVANPEPSNAPNAKEGEPQPAELPPPPEAQASIAAPQYPAPPPPPLDDSDEETVALDFQQRSRQAVATSEPGEARTEEPQPGSLPTPADSVGGNTEAGASPTKGVTGSPEGTSTVEGIRDLPTQAHPEQAHPEQARPEQPHPEQPLVSESPSRAAGPSVRPAAVLPAIRVQPSTRPRASARPQSGVAAEKKPSGESPTGSSLSELAAAVDASRAESIPVPQSAQSRKPMALVLILLVGLVVAGIAFAWPSGRSGKDEGANAGPTPSTLSTSPPTMAPAATSIPTEATPRSTNVAAEPAPSPQKTVPVPASPPVKASPAAQQKVPTSVRAQSGQKASGLAPAKKAPAKKRDASKDPYNYR